MSATTATVETLTAEVRTLMVGSRQVTLSVAKQLDWVDVDEVEPFGRVKIVGPSGPDYPAIIGRHRDDGALVLAENRPPPRPQPYAFSEDAGYHRALDAYDARDAEWRERNALPLIVLAGLR